MKAKVELKENLNLGLYDELEKKIFYISPKINAFKIIADSESITGVELEFDNEEDFEELKRKTLALIDTDVKNRRIIKGNRVWENNVDVKFERDAFDKLVENNMAVQMDEGQVALSYSMIKLIGIFDQYVREIIKNEFDGVEYQYPTLISAATLMKCGNLKTFPQFVMAVSRLHSDFDNYKNFKDELNCDSETEIKYDFLKYCKTTDYFLPPTMCYHVYQQYKNRKLKEGTNFTVTAKGKSFRFENKYQKGLERLWDFTIREIVFLGSKEYVLNCRKKMMEAAFKLCKELNLSVYCETSNDPFFFDESANERIIFQKYLKSKYELRMYIDEKKTISVGSFNYHEKFFSKNFNIKYDNDEFIQTACTGFGLERLAYAFICQYGIDEKNWPVKIREKL